MQIHELNNYGGALDSGAYLAVDNGNDTGKVSAAGLLAETTGAINALDNSLNARIDNIIAGGTAPSAAEVTDARLGADGTQYSSLGAAIRGQFNDLNQYDTGIIIVESGGIADADGKTKTINAWRFRNKYRLAAKNIDSVYAPSGYDLYWFALDEDEALLGHAAVFTTVLRKSDLPAGTVYINFAIRNTSTPTSDISSQIDIVQDGLSVVFYDDLMNDYTDQIKNIYKGLEWNDLTLTWVTGKLLYKYGGVGDISSQDWSVCDEVDVSAFPALKIRASTGYDNAYYAFYDENHTFLYSVAQGGGAPSIYEDIVLLSDKIKYLRVSNFSNNGAFVGVIGNMSTQKWLGKKWVCLGDSLTEVNRRTTKHYHDYIAEETGITVVNMGDSGSGYMNEQNLGTAFYQRAANVPTDADVYTIFGSGNDLSHPLGEPTDTGTTTICGCINETIDVLIGLIPTIQLGIVAPTPWAPYQPDLNDSNAMAQYVKALKEICYIRSIPFLDLYHESNLRPWTAEGRAACFSKDDGGGTHPDEAGHKIIAPRFEGFLDSLLLD